MPSARSAVSLRARQLVANALGSPLPPAEAWDQQFQQERYSSEVLAEAVQTLHLQKKYEQAIECLLSALRNDHAQPWVYDVLAIQMKLAGRPASELDRVLQSRVDFSAGNIAQLLIAAAMLSRFDAHREALDICRRAAEVSPQTPEVWLLARSISDKLDSPKDRVQIRCGILRNYWEDTFPQAHNEAREVISAILNELEGSADGALVSELREEFARANAVDLRISLSWVGTADLDLLVEEPAGTRCSFQNRITRSGGRLVREDGGSSETSGNRTEEYVCLVADNGQYTAVVRFVLGRAVAGSAVLQVIRNQNTPMESRERRTIALSKQDIRIPITVEHGRGKSSP